MEKKEGAGAGVQKAAPEKELPFAFMKEDVRAWMMENDRRKGGFETVKCGGPGCHGCRCWCDEQEEKAAKSVEGGTKGPFGRLKDAPAVLKNKARAAGEYAALRTRQGISMFGEPKIGPIKAIVDRC